ncbi:hypothetical protein SDC9_178274 [bioreactor metagenome]|uniref:Uncharacterized protein n=1 Tax=bioreactor metagenome TaxID=1076179 RepID=A0A645H4P3_9ZZZZ
MLSVHMHVRKMTDRYPIEHTPQGVFHIILIEVGLNAKQQTSLHRHATAPKPIALKIIKRIPVLVRQVQVVLVVLQNRFSLC